MKKKLTALLIMLCICVVTFYNFNLEALAENGSRATGYEEELDYSYFMQDSVLYGYANISRGVYLASGDSGISKINSYTIGATGKTNATLKCDVSVTTIVERYNMETDRWAFITSWTKENTNAFTAIISKSLVVDSGYYYRVRSLHYAGTDASSSWTNALYVGN